MQPSPNRLPLQLAFAARWASRSLFVALMVSRLPLVASQSEALIIYHLPPYILPPYILPNLGKRPDEDVAILYFRMYS